jgi:hypothetical protein
MNKPRSLLLSTFAFALLFLSMTTPAAEFWHTSTVHSLYPQADGSYIIRFNTSDMNCTDANSPKYYYVVVGTYNVTQEAARMIFTLASISIISDKQLSIAFESQGCFVKRALLLD